jgi:hypothetical protein
MNRLNCHRSPLGRRATVLLVACAFAGLATAAPALAQEAAGEWPEGRPLNNIYEYYVGLAELRAQQANDTTNATPAAPIA